MTELWRRSAMDLAQLIASRQVSSTEVVDAHLARIEAVNPKLNAVVRVLAEAAQAQAVAADRKVAAGEALGPLHGVPITVKENIDLAGLPTTNGVVPLAQATAPVDAPVVERMRASGAIPIARTNLPDFGMRVQTDSALHGLTRNPWNATRTAAGSSGGEAAALATGMSPLGLGNDIGGSLRNPASACGITLDPADPGARPGRPRGAGGRPAAGGAADGRTGADGAASRRRAPGPRGAQRRPPARSLVPRSAGARAGERTGPGSGGRRAARADDRSRGLGGREARRRRPGRRRL